MRINLITPFAEKDAVKALGARWDPPRRGPGVHDHTINVKELTFMTRGASQPKHGS
jgi:hypothetical protein